MYMAFKLCLFGLSISSLLRYFEVDTLMTLVITLKKKKKEVNVGHITLRINREDMLKWRTRTGKCSVR